MTICVPGARFCDVDSVFVHNLVDPVHVKIDSSENGRKCVCESRLVHDERHDACLHPPIRRATHEWSTGVALQKHAHKTAVVSHFVCHASGSIETSGSGNGKRVRNEMCFSCVKKKTHGACTGSTRPVRGQVFRSLRDWSSAESAHRQVMTLLVERFLKTQVPRGCLCQLLFSVPLSGFQNFRLE